MPIQPETLEELEPPKGVKVLIRRLEEAINEANAAATELAKEGIHVEYEVLELNTQPVSTMRINPSAKQVLL